MGSPSETAGRRPPDPPPSSAIRRRDLLRIGVLGMGASAFTLPRLLGACLFTALAVEAGRTLLLDRDEMLAAANEAGIAIVGMEMRNAEA